MPGPAPESESAPPAQNRRAVVDPRLVRERPLGIPPNRIRLGRSFALAMKQRRYERSASTFRLTIWQHGVVWASVSLPKESTPALRTGLRLDPESSR